MDSSAHRRLRTTALSSRDSASSSQQESIKKPAQLELLFCKELQKQDTIGVCSLAEEYGSIFLAEQDKSGHVLFNDIQSWLQFAQAKGLTVGDSVTFYRQRATDLFFIDCLPKEPSVLDQISSLNQTNLPPLFDSPFLHYLSLFPEDHEIERDTLIQLGQATGLFADASLASIVSSFKAYQSEGYLYPSRYDETTGKLWYKVTDLVSKHVTNSEKTHLKIDLDDPLDSLSCENSAFEHVTMWRFPSNVIPVLEKFINMRTLWFLKGHRSRTNHVPYDFFTSLKHLQILNLSCTKITELPSSIGHIRGLRYLDLSETLVKNLPGTVGHLKELQTLKLKNCRGLITLSKDTTRLENLQHLDLGVHTYLHCMPPGLGALTRLCTLSPFVIGCELSCGIAELKNLDGLNELRLTKLQNVASSVEAREADLITKVHLRSLELQWSSSGQKISRVYDEVIECLRPHTDLKYFKVLSYGGSKFPSWFSDPSFSNIMSITLFKCENCRVLPPLGRLPSLKFLTIDGLTGIRVIDNQFCRVIEHNDGIDEKVAFPKLKNLALISLLSLEEWKDVHKSDFPSLLKLELKDCPKLVTICSLSDMHSLRHLEISNCPLLRSLPEGRLPASVEELLIEDCPLLKYSCSKPDGVDWHQIEHVGSIWIDYEDKSSR
ncbi:disease resistance protein RGA2-like [Chenopodium quinoa]|uniref:R13L1/DRL21-like LRR repeat region domain-containing protein n=1 Tax=Chenopodium quinoa TaxID=63459 RepID=A0A803LZV5_CHEQI|nr:disease resistance protein RGA2-like [Chenopodium quinoa]